MHSRHFAANWRSHAPKRTNTIYLNFNRALSHSHLSM